jgi:hypothetical protein
MHAAGYSSAGKRTASNAHTYTSAHSHSSLPYAGLNTGRACNAAGARDGLIGKHLEEELHSSDNITSW